MRKTCWMGMVAAILASAGLARADEKPMIPAGGISADEVRKQAAKPQNRKPPATQMSRSRSGIGEFFRKLFGPDEPKINGTIITGAQTYKNGIMPVAPVIPR